MRSHSSVLARSFAVVVGLSLAGCATVGDAVGTGLEPR